jgi:hypothetical protein
MPSKGDLPCIGNADGLMACHDDCTPAMAVRDEAVGELCLTLMIKAVKRFV